MLDEGLANAARRLRPGGLLVANSIDETPAVAHVLREAFPARVRIELSDYDNRILVGGPRGMNGRALRAAAAAHSLFAETLPRLSFRGL